MSVPPDCLETERGYWRAATKKDKRAVREFSCAARSPDGTAPIWETEVEEFFRYRSCNGLGDGNKRTLLYWRYEDNKLVGMITFSSSTLPGGLPVRTLDYFGVSVDARGQGIARVLMELMRNVVLAEVSEAIVCIGDVHRKNEASKRALTKAGFGYDPELEQFVTRDPNYELWSGKIE